MGATQIFSKKVIIKDDYVKKDGTCPLYIYVSIDGKWDRLPLKLSWTPAFFDKDAGKIISRGREDKDFSDYQLMIDTEVGKVNEIMKEYRLGNRVLTVDQLVREFNSYTSRKDFFTFWQADVAERVKRKKIEDGTGKGHVATLNHLKEFVQAEARKKSKREMAANDQPPLPFNDITPKLLENFRAWLRSHKDNVPSTVENHMKNVRTYVKRAITDGNVFDDPFKVVKVTKPETFPNVLTEEQLERLVNLFNNPDTPDNWQGVLRHFLFSCFTGLRIGDARSVGHEHIREGWLVIMPQKTVRKQKTIRVPLHPMALRLIATTLGRLFDTFTEQYTNRLLARIGEGADIDFKITTHTARHTFGTLFIELGGDVVTLKEYMGHRDIGTTMKYVHISERRKKEKINVFDKLFRKDDSQKGAA